VSLLAQTTSGPSFEGQRIVISGTEGVGKTTLACGAPGSLLIPLENGYASITTHRTPQIATWLQLIGLMDEIRGAAQTGKFAHKTLVFDSATALERMIEIATIEADPDHKKKKLTMATAHGGYGKAFVHMRNLFQDFIARCDELAKYAKINIVITCHTFASKVIDPAYGEYLQWELLLYSPKDGKTYGPREFITQWADLIGFMHEPLFVTKEDNHKMAVSANQGRMLAVDRSPQWVAKNRYDLTETIAIPKENSWNYLADAIYKSKGIDLYNREGK